MIRINYLKEAQRHKLSVSGHAGYAENGKDIVCAGASAISLSLLSYITKVGNVHELRYGSGELFINCDSEEKTDIAFDMAVTGYADLAQHYPQHVEVYIAANGG